MKRCTEDLKRLGSMVSLNCSLEEAEIIRTGMKLVLMDPSLDSTDKGEYERAFTRLSDEIRKLRKQKSKFHLPKD